MSEQKTESGMVLRIYLSEKSRSPGADRPLAEELIQRARIAGLAGATLFRGSMGFGAHQQLHTEKILELSTDQPEVIEIIDRADKIQAFQQSIQKLTASHCVAAWPVDLWLPDSDE